MMFTIFLLGPCEPLIPLVIYPASQQQWWLVGMVTAVFAVATLASMTAAVLLCDLAARQFRFPSLERYAHALAGAMVALCGVGMLALGL
jgi:nickel/cobalt exporter